MIEQYYSDNASSLFVSVLPDCDCWRTRSSPASSYSWYYSNDPSGSNNVDAIDFQTDDDVVLSGYRLWGVRSGSTSFHVTIRLYRARSLIAEKTGTYATSSNVKTFEVHFSQAIILKAGVTYTATARIATSATSYLTENGLSSTTCSGVTVAFKRSSKDTNSSNVSRGQIPALIFRSAKCYKQCTHTITVAKSKSSLGPIEFIKTGWSSVNCSLSLQLRVFKGKGVSANNPKGGRKK